MALSDFIGSPLFWVIVYVIVTWYILKIVSQELLGQPIGMFIMNNRRINFDDIDSTAHLRMWREQARAARFSKGTGPRWLFIQSTDSNYYSTDWAGQHYIGRIKGVATYPSAHLILFRKPWGIRKWLFIAKPEMCVSGTGSKNLIYEGQSVEVLNQDWVFPIPTVSDGDPEDAEEKMRLWALDQYKIRMKQMSDGYLTDYGEYLLIKSASDSVEARMAQQQLTDWMSRAESAEVEAGQSEGFD